MESAGTVLYWARTRTDSSNGTAPAGLSGVGIDLLFPPREETWRFFHLFRTKVALFIASASVKPYFWAARQTSLHLWAREEVAAAILLHQSLAQCWLSSWLEAGRVGYNTDKLMFLLFSSFPSLFKLCFPPPHHTGLGPTASTNPHKAEEGPREVWR